MILWSIQFVWSLLFERGCGGCVVALNMFLRSLLCWTVIHEWLTLGTLAQRGLQYLVWFVIPSVCLSVCYHIFCHHAQRDNKIADTNRFISTLAWFSNFVQVLRSKVMAWKPSEQTNTLINTRLPRHLLCVPQRHKKQKRRACIDSRMLSTIYCR